MEFEQRKQVSDDISDETRLLAASRHTTLEPIHTEVAPEDMSNEFIASKNVLSPPLGNIPSDSEATISYIETSQSDDKTPSRSHMLPLLISVGTAVAVVAIGITFYLLVIK